jgi:hypothetical protein
MTAAEIFLASVLLFLLAALIWTRLQGDGAKRERRTNCQSC